MKTYSMELFENEVHQVRKLVSFIYCPMHGEATVFTTTPGCNVAHRFNYSVFAKLNPSSKYYTKKKESYIATL